MVEEMKKIYFAKFIESDEDFKVGSKIKTYFNPEVTVISEKEYYANGGDETGLEIERIEDDKLIIKINNNPFKDYCDIFFYKGECKAIKLCLCSRDIQIGDKFKSIHYPDKEFIRLQPIPPKKADPNSENFIDRIQGIHPSGSYYTNDGKTIQWIPFEEGYKVIGQISSDANWVKEGDEFIAEGNECEVFPYHTHNEEDESIIYTDKYDEPLPEGVLPIFKIKGPCGHFH